MSKTAKFTFEFYFYLINFQEIIHIQVFCITSLKFGVQNAEQRLSRI